MDAKTKVPFYVTVSNFSFRKDDNETRQTWKKDTKSDQIDSILGSQGSSREALGSPGPFVIQRIWL